MFQGYCGVQAQKDHPRARALSLFLFCWPFLLLYHGLFYLHSPFWPSAFAKPTRRRPDAISLVGYDALFCVYAVRLHLLQSRMSAVHDWLRQLEQLCASLAKGESNMHDLQVVPLLYSLGYAVSHGEALDIMAAEMLVELGTKN